MDDENKDLEDPMETGMLDDMINYNIDVWETQNELVENHQTLEENKPKKKSKLRKILFIILWVFWVLFLLRLAIVFLFLKWLSNLAEKMGSTNISMEQEDWLYEFNGHWRHNWIDSYMLTPVNSNEIVIWDDTFEMSYDDSFQNMINLSTKDYSWIEGMYNFDPYIYLDLKFSEWKIMDWSIVDIKTKKNLWQLNFDELNQMYNFEAKYPIKEIEKKNLLFFIRKVLHLLIHNMNQIFILQMMIVFDDLDIVLLMKQFIWCIKEQRKRIFYMCLNLCLLDSMNIEKR